MVLAETDPQRVTAATQPTRCLYLILFPVHVQERIEAILDDVGVPGYSRTPDVLGRGPRRRDPWPVASGEIFTAIDAELGKALMQRLTELDVLLQAESRGHRGLHVLSWPCDVLL